MKNIIRGLLILMMIISFFPAFSSADMIIFPAQGQTAEQQQKDEGDCRQWAMENTGVDPVKLAQQPVDTSAPKQGGAVGGAARGALLGTAVGAIAGDAGKGAAIGATVLIPGYVLPLQHYLLSLFFASQPFITVTALKK